MSRRGARSLAAGARSGTRTARDGGCGPARPVGAAAPRRAPGGSAAPRRRAPSESARGSRRTPADGRWRFNTTTFPGHVGSLLLFPFSFSLKQRHPFKAREAGFPLLRLRFPFCPFSSSVLPPPRCLETPRCGFGGAGPPRAPPRAGAGVTVRGTQRGPGPRLRSGHSPGWC